MTRIPLKTVLEAAAIAHGMTAADLRGISRTADRVRARQSFMALAREVCTASLPSIGMEVNRDHTTVLHGLKKHADWLEKSFDYRRAYEKARRLVHEADKAARARRTGDLVAAREPHQPPHWRPEARVMA